MSVVFKLFFFDNAVYDKMIRDINAKTSIIQQEDQQLELRLKQLDTEQSALSTEMEAVKKVVEDNVTDRLRAMQKLCFMKLMTDEEI